MPVIAITCEQHAAPRQLTRRLAEAHGATIYTDTDLMEAAASTHGLPQGLILRVVHGKPIPHNEFSHDRERSVSTLKKTLSEALTRGNCIFTGTICHLIPRDISHVFWILATAPERVRLCRAMERDQLTETSARDLLHTSDLRNEQWIETATGKPQVDPSLYDLVISHEDAYTDRINMDAALVSSLAAHITTALDQPPFNRTKEAEISDFRITSDVEIALSSVGPGLLVETRSGKVVVTLDRKVMNLSKMQQAIMAAAESVAGVKGVKTKIGPNYYKSSIIKNFDTGPPGGYRNKY